MISSITAAMFAGLVAGNTLQKLATGLDVKLSMTNNTEVLVQITNTGSTSVRLLNRGTLLDTAAVRKIEVSSSSASHEFQGLRKRIRSSGLKDDAFTPLVSGQTRYVYVDIASTHDLSTGILSLVAYGAIPFAGPQSNSIIGSISYRSNKLVTFIDGAAAAKVEKALERKDKRSYEQGDCSGDQWTTTAGALLDCAALASAASNEAMYGDVNRFAQYFRTTDNQARFLVGARLAAVSNECANSPNGGGTSLHCADIYGACDSNTLAYTVSSDNTIVNCPLYFQVLPLLSGACHQQDQATTTLHEMTHAPNVFSPETNDYAYGIDADFALSPDLATNNADTYAMFANAVHAGC